MTKLDRQPHIPPRSPPPLPAIILDYRGPDAVRSQPPMAVRFLTFSAQFVVGIVSPWIWLFVTFMAASYLSFRSSQLSTVFWLVTAGVYVALIILAVIRFRWTGLVPGVITGIILMPLVGIGLLFYACVSILQSGAAGSGAGGH